MDEIEIWKSIPSHPRYEASSLGRIRALWGTGRWDKHKKLDTPHVLWIHNHKKQGYQSACVDSENRWVHALVCEAFHGLRPDGMEVAHEDGIRAHNWSGNLSWKTPTQNQADRLRHGTDNRGEKQGASILNEEAVRNIRSAPKGGLGDLCIKYGIKYWTMIAIRQRKSWKHVA